MKNRAYQSCFPHAFLPGFKNSIKPASVFYLLLLSLTVAGELQEATAQSRRGKNTRTSLAPAAADTLAIEANVQKFFDYQQLIRPEKLWLHTDKPYYSAGETIWFKGYLVGAVNHAPRYVLSNFIRIELIDRKDSIALTCQAKRDTLHDGFHGGIPLPPDLLPGEYTLRAYTRWMQNNAPEFFFIKNIRIGNSIANDVNSSVEYYETGGKLTARITFIDGYGSAFAGRRFEYGIRDRNGRVVSTGGKKTDSKGVVEFSIPQQKQKEDWIMDIDLVNDPLEYKRSLHLPYALDSYNVTFFPEGGPLLWGETQQVAFKALHPDGSSADVSGYILDNRNDTVTMFSSRKGGIGSFYFRPEKERSYRAVSSSNDGVKQTFELPAVQDRGLAVAVSQRKNELWFQVLSAGGNATFAQHKPLWLIVHSRARLLAIYPVEKTTGMIKTEDCPQGILHILLVNAQGIPQSERLVFIRHTEEDAVGKISPNKPDYKQREKETVTFAIRDSAGKPVEGDFSVSITDRRTVRYDTLADNIVSNLLLTSDLKGYIEDPAYYFTTETPQLAYERDLLMQTHGWSRFSTGNLGRLPEVQKFHRPEHEQFLSGTVQKPNGKPVPNANVIVIEYENGFSRVIQTDEEGKFHLSGFNIRDTVKMMVIARTQKNSDQLDIVLDNVERPALAHKTPFRGRPEVKSRKDTPQEEESASKDPLEDPIELYLSNTRRTYFAEGGLPVYNIRKITVTANRPQQQVQRIIPWNPVNDKIYGEEQLKNYKGSLVNVLRHLSPYFRILNEDDYTIPPVYLGENDFIRLTYSELSNIQASDVENLVQHYIPGQPGFFHLFLKMGAGVRPLRGAVHLNEPGYGSTIREFYHPAYDTPAKQRDPKPDLRTTIYWNPVVHTGADGKATLEFYTTDAQSADYEITIEGLTDSGTPYHYQGRLK